MADQKISQLTAATTPLAGTEVLPIVQAGATVKVATDNLTVKNIRSNATSGILQVVGPAAAATRVMTVPDANFTVARTDAAQTLTGNQTITNGNVVMSSGYGIDFSATSGTGTSELLNDYEEGTWTPVLSFVTPGDLSVSYASRVGTYTKIGNRVVLQCFIQTSAFTFTTSASALIVNGIPFSINSSSSTTNYGAGQFGGVVKVGYTDFSASADNGLTTAILFYCSGSGVSPDFIAAADTPSGGTMTVKFTIVYQA